jgi:hypothetical protein
VRRFSAPWDGPLVLSTVFLLAVILATAIAGFSTAAHVQMRGLAAGIAAAAGGTAIATWALAPRGFEIGGGTLRILRNGWTATAIPLSHVRSAAIVAPGALRGASPLVGVGGLFGSYGYCRSPALGPIRIDATRGDGLVLVRTARSSHVLTPDRPGEFVEALLAAAPDARREVRSAAG